MKFKLCLIVLLLNLLSIINTSADTLRVNNFLAKAWEYKRKNTDSSLYFSKLAKTEATRINFKKGVALSYKMEASSWYNKGEYSKAIELAIVALKKLNEINASKIDLASTNNLIGLANMSKGDYDEAEIYFIKARNLYQNVNDILGEVSTIHNLGVVNFYLGNYDKAMELYTKALSKCEGKGDLQTESDILINVGILLNQEMQFEKAISYYRKAYQIQSKLNDRRGMGQTLSSIGTCYFSQSNLDSSLYYHKASLDTFKAGKMYSGIAQSLCNTGDILLLKKDYNAALKLYLEALELRTKTEERYGLTVTYNNIAKVFTALNNWFEAEKNFKVAEQYAQQLNSAYLMSEIYQARALMYEKKGDFKSAFIDINQYHQLKDSLYSNEKSKVISELQTRYNSEKAENELLIKSNKIQSLEKEKRLNQIKYYSLLALAITAAFAFWQFNTKKKTVLENKLLQSEKEKFYLESQGKLSKTKLEKETIEKELVLKELEHKKQELVQMALYISQQNEFLENLHKNISISKANNKSTLILEKELEQKLNLDKQREQFKLNINLINEDFYNLLHYKFPNLTDGEKKLCAMLRLNLSSKEIASIQNISPKSVDMSRYRLRKKLNLPADKELSDYLAEI